MALKKNPQPTFKQGVEIPVPGAKPEKVELTFKHKRTKEYKQFVEDCIGRDDVESTLEVLTDWNLTEEFGPVSKESIAEMYEAYPGAPNAVFLGFSKGLHQGRLGN